MGTTSTKGVMMDMEDAGSLVIDGCITFLRESFGESIRIDVAELNVESIDDLYAELGRVLVDGVVNTLITDEALADGITETKPENGITDN
ncbi:hypothetical protein [Vibrio mediterranei]|uniref:hypothetical protein n=1 Tax=Vibrio mediterranei TaxID=689 RepID=UPI0040686A23